MPATTTSVVRHLSFSGPFKDVETSVLVDSLEAQYERAEPLDPELVWEIVERLAAAERLGSDSSWALDPRRFFE